MVFMSVERLSSFWVSVKRLACFGINIDGFTGFRIILYRSGFFLIRLIIFFIVIWSRNFLGISDDILQMRALIDFHCHFLEFSHFLQGLRLKFFLSILFLVFSRPSFLLFLKFEIVSCITQIWFLCIVFLVVMVKSSHVVDVLMTDRTLVVRVVTSTDLAHALVIYNLLGL